MIRPPASTGDAALWYGELGWRIFPLAGKHPAIKGGRGCHDATTDRETVVAWWRLRPPPNIGWALGIGESLYVVLDDDAPWLDGGQAMLLSFVDDETKADGFGRLDLETAWMAKHHQMLEARLDRLGEFLERTKGTPS